MRSSSKLDDAIETVIRSDRCSGCGACVALDEGLEMRLDADGYHRPVRRNRTDPSSSAETVSRFRRVCPGVEVRAQKPRGSRRDPILGPIVQAWEAHAADDQQRFAGSSGGALTALSGWLVESGRAAEVIGAAADSRSPRRTVSVQITSREEALAAAGSRYAPASNAALGKGLTGASAFVGKPCEVSAIRALTTPPAGNDVQPILLSFFCAGTPSQHATDDLVEKVGVSRDEPIRALRYRGHGWPGDFTVVRQDGSAERLSYDESWGKHLGPTTQWRCKICPDGVGESADVSAADYWRADGRGYPDFSNAAGSSALLARTERGRAIVLEAEREGVLVLGPIDLAALVGVQPLQRSRRQTLVGRLVGTVVAGGEVPRFHGFGLVRLALPRIREVYRTSKGTFRRRRRAAGGTRP